MAVVQYTAWFITRLKTLYIQLFSLPPSLSLSLSLSLPPFNHQDIVVLRFDQVEEDSIAYMAMLNYLVGKHRCGVIKSGHHGIKDMYLLPLLRNASVAPQLLPFDGPG